MTDLTKNIVLALQNKPSTQFAAEDVNKAAVNGIMEACGLTDASSPREFRLVQDKAFALIEEAIDEVLPAKIESIVGEFAEVRQFDRNAEVVFDIEKVGQNRAKLTIAKGARAGIYRAAKLSNRWFSPAVTTWTAAVYVTLEDLILGTQTLGDLFNNIVEGFSEAIFKEIYNALATGVPVTGYERISAGTSVTTTKDQLSNAIDKVLPYVKAYGMATIFGSYATLNNIYNPLAAASGYPNIDDSRDVREYGRVMVYKGVRCVELPNYLVDTTNSEWFYDQSYVFVIPSNAKPVKVALKGETYIQKNEQAVGSEKWEAHKLVGVGVAMANNYAVIQVTDLAD